MQFLFRVYFTIVIASNNIVGKYKYFGEILRLSLFCIIIIIKSIEYEVEKSKYFVPVI